MRAARDKLCWAIAYSLRVRGRLMESRQSWPAPARKIPNGMARRIGLSLITELNMTTTDQDFVIERTFNAPCEIVWKAWTDPNQMARWWGPRAITTPICALDVRPGGSYRIVMRGPDGMYYPIKGVYREVKTHELIVMTMDCTEHPDAWHDMVNPDRKGDPNPAGEMLMTVTFEDFAGKTKLTIRTRFKSAMIRDSMVK